MKGWWKHVQQHTAAALGITLIVGGIVGWSMHEYVRSSAVYRGSIIRDDHSGYALINPLLSCEVGPEEAFPEFAPIKAALVTLIDQKKASGAATNVSVYMRSLKGGRWFAIHGNDTYAPASMMKVFVMVAFYKQAEAYPEILRKHVLFQGSSRPGDDPGQVIPRLKSGTYYAISDLIRQMIVYSDNDALNVLVDHFDQNTLAAFNGIFTDLNIPSPATQSEEALDFMSPMEYSLIYRVLFGATYLSRDYSEAALKLLSTTQYQDGIAAGVPQGTVVAHKFGVTSVPQQGSVPETHELHDCGVVYYPNHPYLLCVMTKGGSFELLQQTLQDVSRTAYEKIDPFYKSIDQRVSSGVRN